MLGKDLEYALEYNCYIDQIVRDLELSKIGTFYMNREDTGEFGDEVSWADLAKMQAAISSCRMQLFEAEEKLKLAMTEYVEALEDEGEKMKRKMKAR